MKNRKPNKGESKIAILLIMLFTSAWITHVVTCFTDERWGFLIAGALFFPIAIVHGIGIWLGFW